MNRVAIIVAGGSGIGADAARKLAEDGYALAVLFPSGPGSALAERLGGVAITGSNQSNEDLARLVDRAMRRWGRIDALVNSAAHGAKGAVLDITDEDWRAGTYIYRWSKGP